MILAEKDLDQKQWESFINYLKETRLIPGYTRNDLREVKTFAEAKEKSDGSRITPEIEELYYKFIMKQLAEKDSV
jgi:hypothetical protein